MAAALLALAPGAARGDGLPVGNVDVGKEGVVVPSAPDRIVALPAGRGQTLVARVQRDGGRVERVLRLRERLTVPAVALDGTADGRSADGETVVLLRPRPAGEFPRARTRFVVLSVRPLRVERRLTLRGDFSFDALSPDGRRMYLIEYDDARDQSRYVVRSFDLRRGRLEPGAVVDPREPDERMAGFPMTRATTDDGRWAYTLYSAEEPFIHALDTVSRKAFCIDLPWLAESEPTALRLRIGDGGLSVAHFGDVVANVDTETMEPSDPKQAASRVAVRSSRSSRSSEEPSSGPDWWLVGVLAAFGFVAIAGTRAVRRSRTAR